MGTNIISIKLLEEKNQILDSILEGLRTWDGEIESGIDLMDINQKKLESIKDINNKLYEEQGEFFDQKGYYKRITEIVIEIRKMTEAMEIEKQKILKEKRVLDKKDNLIGSYITTNKNSIFIDKDIY